MTKLIPAAVACMLGASLSAFADRELPDRELADREVAVGLPNPLAELRFDRGSVQLGPTAEPVLAGVVRWMQDNPNRILYIEGHADPSGSRDLNIDLSARRSDAVRDELIRLGADPLRMIVAGYGESLPR